MFKKKKIEKKEQTFQEFVKSVLICSGVTCKTGDNENIVAIYGILDLNDVSKKIVEHIHKTPIEKLFPQMEIDFTIDSSTYVGGTCKNGN